MKSYLSDEVPDTSIRNKVSDLAEQRLCFYLYYLFNAWLIPVTRR